MYYWWSINTIENTFKKPNSAELHFQSIGHFYFTIMADNKKSIIVYADWMEQFTTLTDEEAGRLIKHFFMYVNDLNPTPIDRITEISFLPIKQSLKRDLKKWEKELDDRSLNGRIGNLKRWNLDIYNQFILEKITLEEAENIAKHRKVSPPDEKVSPPIANIAVNDNVNVSVNDIKNNNNIDSRKLKFAHTLKPFLDIYSKETIREFYEYWVEPNKSNTKFRMELEKTWDTARRLKTWNKNNFNTKQNGKSKITDLDEFKQITDAIKSDGVRR